MSSHTDGQAMAFIGRPDLADISQRGPVTPDHVIRTKPVPLLGRDVDAFVAAYRRYFDDHRHRAPARRSSPSTPPPGSSSTPSWACAAPAARPGTRPSWRTSTATP